MTTFDGYEHAWRWFELHSTQRMQSINMYFVVVAAVLAFAGSDLANDRRQIGIFVGLFLFASSGIFYMIDRRTRSLIKLAEAALKLAEKSGSNDARDPVRLVEASDRAAARGPTYTIAFNCAFVLTALAGATLAGFAVAARG